jgi:hypothetical protein
VSDKPAAGYVVCFIERLRDGIEEGARAFDNLPAALAFINTDFFAKNNYTFRLFTLGEEIPLHQEKVQIPQPMKDKIVYKVKGDGA